jgi:hypothetical protein
MSGNLKQGFFAKLMKLNRQSWSNASELFRELDGHVNDILVNAIMSYSSGRDELRVDWFGTNHAPKGVPAAGATQAKKVS